MGTELDNATANEQKMQKKGVLYQAVRWIVIISFIVMVVSAWLQVISRYIIQYPLGWTGELSRIMLFWFTFMSIGALVFQRSMMRVDAFVSAVPAWLQTLLSIVVHVVQSLFFVWLIYLSMRLVILAKDQVSTALRIPYSYIYFSLPLGLAIGGFYSLKLAWKDMKGLFAGEFQITKRGEGEG